VLHLNQVELSQLAAVSAATIKRIEATPGIRGSASTLWKIQKALETAAVEFIPKDETKGPGVRLKQSQRAKEAERRGRRRKSV
jgi:transcriptional regulator with XRE-family HTH domain